MLIERKKSTRRILAHSSQHITNYSIPIIEIKSQHLLSIIIPLTARKIKIRDPRVPPSSLKLKRKRDRRNILFLSIEEL